MQRTGCLSFILAAIMAILCMSAVSCGGASYKTDVDVTALPPLMEIDVSKFDGHIVKLRASGANIDEYGIFKASENATTADIKSTVEQYLARRVEVWMPEYMPEEFPKMEAASIKVIGEYVVYAILSEDVKADVFSAIEVELTEK